MHFDIFKFITSFINNFKGQKTHLNLRNKNEPTSNS